jgi:glutathione S-transferase
MSQAVLTISSRNYSSWSLRGWLLCRLAGLDFTEKRVPIDDPSLRAELLMLTPSFLVPRLEHDGVVVWDALAIAGYLAETFPEAGLLPADRKARAHCRSICGEIHSGFSNMRSALPMNLRARPHKTHIFTGAKPDIARVETIWQECLGAYGGPYLFGKKPTAADAMFAPVTRRFLTYMVELSEPSRAYCATIDAWPPMGEWIAAAQEEPEELEALDVDF